MMQMLVEEERMLVAKDKQRSRLMAGNTNISSEYRGSLEAVCCKQDIFNFKISTLNLRNCWKPCLPASQQY